MPLAEFDIDPGSPLLAVTVHNGHELSQAFAGHMALDDATRLREEDPYTELLVARIPSRIVVGMSRFEADLNRPRGSAVYATPEDAWGLDLWRESLTQAEIEDALQKYDDFYAELGRILDATVDRHGGFVLYDVHSFNHRRGGPDADPEPQLENPDLNLGTGSLPDIWRPVASAFLDEVRSHDLDARENVKFRGRQIAQWTHENYGPVACCLAIEFKKTFMDEWTGEMDEVAVDRLAAVLDSTVDPVIAAWRAACP